MTTTKESKAVVLTPALLDREARALFEFGQECLRKELGVAGFFHILFSDGTNAVVSVDMNDHDEKSACSQAIRLMVKHGRIAGVMMLSETWVGRATPEQYKEMEERGLSVREAGDLGIVPVEEALLVNAEMRGHALRISQKFRREGKDSRERVIFEGQPEEQSWELADGRFMNFFGSETVQ